MGQVELCGNNDTVSLSLTNSIHIHKQDVDCVCKKKDKNLTTVVDFIKYHNLTIDDEIKITLQINKKGGK